MMRSGLIQQIAFISFLMVALLPNSLGQEVTTRIMDNTTIIFPDSFPTAIISPLIQIQTFEVPMERKIAVIWEDDGVQNVTLQLLVPPEADMSPGVSVKRVEGSYVQLVTFSRSGDLSKSWLNLTSSRTDSGELLYSQEPEALFGRAQLGWKVDAVGYPSAPVNSIVSLRVPRDVKVRYSSRTPVDVTENEYFFEHRSGFIYLESSETKSATIQLLLVLVATIILILVVSSFDSVQTLKSWVLAKGRSILRDVGIRGLLVAFTVVTLLTIGLSLAIGPSPRVNLAAIIGPGGDYVNSLSGGSIQVVRTSERAIELMLSFDVVDMIVVEDYKLPEKVYTRWRNILRSASSKGIPTFVGEGAMEINRELFASEDVTVLDYEGAEEYLSSRLTDIVEMKKGENRLGLGWGIFMPLLIIVVILSLFSIALGAMSAGYLTFYFRERVTRSVNRLALCVFSFFAFFVIGVVLYTVGSYLLQMPLGWHGPIGKGITAISVLSTSFGGGNFPRAGFALLGLAAIVMLYVARSKLRLSFSLLGLFALLALYLFVSTPLTAPTLFRFISGETPNTPPRDYFSRSSVNSLTSVEYQFQESVAGVFMAVLGTESLDTWLSRGMIASLAFAGAFFTLTMNSARTNAMIIPLVFLVISRLFARIGDLQLEKSLWTLPTALVISTLVVVSIRLLDLVISGFGNALESHKDSFLYMIVSVFVPLIIGFTVLYRFAGTDMLTWVLLGWSLLCIAGLSARVPWDWRRMKKGSVESI